MYINPEDPIIQALINLGEKHDEIRAVILTSSRANGTYDLLSGRKSGLPKVSMIH